METKRESLALLTIARACLHEVRERLHPFNDERMDFHFLRCIKMCESALRSNGLIPAALPTFQIAAAPFAVSDWADLGLLVVSAEQALTLAAQQLGKRIFQIERALTTARSMADDYACNQFHCGIPDSQLVTKIFYMGIMPAPELAAKQSGPFAGWRAVNAEDIGIMHKALELVAMQKYLHELQQQVA